MRGRLVFLLSVFAFLFFAIIIRLFYWQIIKAPYLQSLAQAQYGKTIQTFAQRGEIRASDNFPLVTNKLSYLVFANPKEIKNISETTNVLSSILSTKAATISAMLNLNRFWVPLSSNVEYSIKNQIDSLKIPGVGFEESYTTFYPEASMAAQLLGFVGKDDEGNPKGYFGLEGYYDGILKGRQGLATEINDALGRPVLSQLNDDSGKQDGRSLNLNIDRSIQFITEQKLKDGIDKFGADSGMVVVMNPKTGGILAMASFPSFDESTFYKFDPVLYKNPAITDTYEPGSTLKPLIMSAAFDSGLVKPDSICPICGGPVQIGDYSIETWNKKHYPDRKSVV